MKGYKALSMDMRAVNGNGMQYEMGRLYSVKGDVIPCENGFHFCQVIEELNDYYYLKNSRIFEIEAYGKIEECGCKCVAEKIQLVKELTTKEINDYFKQNQEKFVESEDWYVRQAVAWQGYGLDKLIQDGNGDVRATVAEQGYGLDRLVSDKDFVVRKAVAEQGYGLDILVYDEDEDVRKAVAEQGYGLDILINDKVWQVRAAVARQGYGLDKLIYNENEFVRYTAQKELEYNK